MTGQRAGQGVSMQVGRHWATCKRRFSPTLAELATRAKGDRSRGLQANATALSVIPDLGETKGVPARTAWQKRLAPMCATHFLMKTLPRVAAEMALHVLA